MDCLTAKPKEPFERLTKQGRPLDVLIVDDNRVNQRLLVKFVDKGLRANMVASSENGQIAADQARRMRFDIILMDARMPVMDGLQATRLIREHERSNLKIRTPIIGMLNYASQETPSQCLESGMDDTISKPLSFTLLMEKIKRALDPEKQEIGQGDNAWVVVDQVDDWEVVEWN
ncbi:CheY-like protein [Thozetella sp. PMI_491]|nr:CheY-like protein [Thozetella sp. PMI_491]